MADIYSTVQFTIQILQPYIEKEVSLIRGLQDKEKYIRDELNIMLALLRDTDKRAKENESVKEWIKQMRTLAHDIEDVTEAYKLFQKENAFGKVKQCLSLKVRDIASTIESLRERAKELDRRKDSCSLRNNGDSVVQQEHDCSQIQGTFSVCLAQESELVGAETAEQDLIKKLGLQELDEDSRLSRMIAVIGKGGLGKTSVVWSVYNDGNVKDYFPIRAWVHVVRPYNLVVVLKSIIKQFYKAAGELHVKKDRIDSMDVMSLENLVRSYLDKRYMAAVNPFKKKKKRYMVVIDDVQDLDGDRKLANYIKRLLPTDNNKGSKIIMTTRYESVARTWLDGSDHGLYKLEPLEPAKAWELFCKKAFHRHRGKCPSSLHDVARDIVNRCEGVPLIVLEMGRFLSIKPYDRHEWIKVQQNLGFFLQNDLTGLHNILNHSYHSLLSHLKPCVLYFGLFPKGYTVDRMRLIRLWIAEGFIIKQSSSNLTLEEVAEEYIDHLIHMSLVEVEYADATGKPKTLRVHEFLHEIILSKVKELDFCHTLPESNTNIIDLRVVPRRLSINVNPAKEIIIGSKSNTRSILLITDNSSPPVKLWPKVLTKALNNNRQLKVLDLCNAPIDEFPKEVGKLLNLQYLSLRNTRVKMIPSSIGKLQDLQTLDLKQTPIRELPAEINELHKLRHLLTYCYEYDPAFSRHTGKITGVKIPNGALEKFEGLQKLAFVDVEHTSTVIKELRNLRQLRKLGIVGLKLEHGEDLCAAIAEMKCLHSFSVYSENKTEGMDLEHLHQSLPSTLKRLYLNGRLKNGPLKWCFNGWISKLHSLVKLRLRWSSLEDDPLDILGKLPNLVELQLLEAYNGDILEFKDGGFKKLNTLNLLDLRNLKSLSICKGALPLLQLMAIGKSPKLEVPLGIEHLSRLETLNLFDMPLDFAHSLQQPDGIYHSVVRHVPNVWLQQINNQGIWYPTAL